MFTVIRSLFAITWVRRSVAAVVFMAVGYFGVTRAVDHVTDVIDRAAKYDDAQVEIQRNRIRGIGRTYLGGGNLVALIGSHGYLEVAAPGASAALILGARVGTVVRVIPVAKVGASENRRS